MQNLRVTRAEASMKRELSMLFISGLSMKLGLDKVNFVITRVSISKDLKVARCYISLERPDVINQMNIASGYIAHILSLKLKFRHVPQLKFFYDQGLARASEVECTLNNIASTLHSEGI